MQRGTSARQVDVGVVIGAQRRAPSSLQSETISVLVAGFCPLLREGLSRVIERAPRAELTGATGSAAAALALSRRQRPTVVIVDEMLDQGFALLRALVAAPAQQGIVMLLRPAGEPAVRATEAVRAGATAVAPSTLSSETLLEAMRHAARGQRYLAFDGPPAGLGNSRESQGAGGGLSPRETEITWLIAEGLDNEVIAGRLHLSVQTVRTHCRNIARKLGARDRAQIIVFAYRAGVLHCCCKDALGAG